MRLFILIAALFITAFIPTLNSQYIEYYKSMTGEQAKDRCLHSLEGDRKGEDCFAFIDYVINKWNNNKFCLPSEDSNMNLIMSRLSDYWETNPDLNIPAEESMINGLSWHFKC